MPNKTDTSASTLAGAPSSVAPQDLVHKRAAQELSDKGNEFNNFDFLRFAAATLVILHHSYALLVKPEPLFTITGAFSFGDFAVGVFFVISGFLITASYERCRAVVPFLSSRFLRMWPALIAACCFAVFLIGPLNTKWALSDYFKSPWTWSYFKNLGLINLQWQLPGVFISNPFKEVVNGSLWTLPIEVSMYAVTLCLGLLGIYRFRYAVLAAFALVLVLQMRLLNESHAAEITFQWFPLWLGETRFSTLYLGGAVLYLFRDVCKFNWKLASICLLLFVGSFATPMFKLVMFLTLPYLVLYSAFAVVPYLNRFGRFGDFSYGLYVYAFPVQQTIVNYTGGHLSVFRFFCLSFVITLALAVLSYHCLERPCLNLKRYFKKGASVA
ncbi:MAG: acyltransferase [Candidatus Melainabacteria bacterium]|nr:MAG: acyltransferase [Candidatus Melainabacteria bacterium]